MVMFSDRLRNRDSYYHRKIEELTGGKDSVMEPAKILDYDSKRLVAHVYTVNSKQYKKDVPVLFSSMFLNTGHISPPSKNSTSLLYWGSDRQPYLLPLQLNIPNAEVHRGLTKLNASPSIYDDLLSIENIQGGEQLLRSIGGAYLFLKNLGEVELGTNYLHRIALNQSRGAFEAGVERLDFNVSNNPLYLGPLSRESREDNRTHFSLQLNESSLESDALPDMGDKELIDQVLSKHLEPIELQDVDPIIDWQMVHVTDEDEVVYDEEDGTELSERKKLSKDGIVHEFTTSKGGRSVNSLKEGDNETSVVQTPYKIEMTHEHVIDNEKRTAKIAINEEGKIVCEEDGQSYDLMPMLKWFYEERSDS